MDEKKRPVSVTVIAWILIVTSAMSLVITPLTLRTPQVQQFYEAVGVSLVAALIWGIVVNAITLLSGIAILKGLNWGRLVYLCFTPVSMVFGTIIIGFRPMYVFSVIYYIVILFFLTRPAAAAFFKRGPSVGAKPEKKKGMLRKIASVVLLSIGGFFLMCLFVPFMLIFEQQEVAISISGLILLIFAGLATPFLVGGVGLWGWKRWRIVLGVVLTAVGGELALSAIIMPLVMLSPEWEIMGGKDVPPIIKPLLRSSAIFGALFLAIGILLILRQKKRDKSLTA